MPPVIFPASIFLTISMRPHFLLPSLARTNRSLLKGILPNVACHGAAPCPPSLWHLPRQRGSRNRSHILLLSAHSVAPPRLAIWLLPLVRPAHRHWPDLGVVFRKLHLRGVLCWPAISRLNPEASSFFMTYRPGSRRRMISWEVLKCLGGMFRTPLRSLALAGG